METFSGWLVAYDALYVPRVGFDPGQDQFGRGRLIPEWLRELLGLHFFADVLVIAGDRARTAI